MRVLSKVEKFSILCYRYFFIIISGGLIYGTIELLYRGYTHISMFLLGGLCFLLCGKLSDRMNNKYPLPAIMLLSSLVITALEFVCGCLVNLWLCLGVWDYSNMTGHLLGQVCPAFTVAWFFLSLPAIYLYDAVLYIKFARPRKKYRILQIPFLTRNPYHP